MKESRSGSTRVDVPARAGGVPLWPLLALSLASGAVDALAVVALGGAFAGVMTGNLVFLGAALGSPGLPEGVAAPAAAVGGYVCGTACAAPALRARWGGPLRVLGAETVVLAVVAVVWAAGRPTGSEPYALLAALAAAMGGQASAVLALGPAGAPTTFFTSTLTSLVLDLARGGASGARRRPWPGCAHSSSARRSPRSCTTRRPPGPRPSPPPSSPRR
ncbi:DUF1275 family protein [Streptomyces sp. DfronAA-171]|uniref:DUF1275 family protein n=1 Tax=Streptomyces sp. DfronAA-171 TaxID=1839777 RepID=UPI00081D7ABA|nr:DUF1275 family protein [Streptomyces sp. DfronAA-171]SCD33643.1 Uncharacterized membrane protein YoaK, UPF0700 family [Streptomyces sp. DfronAA-171]